MNELAPPLSPSCKLCGSLLCILKVFIFQSEHILQDANISVWNKCAAFIPEGLVFI